MAKRPKQRKQHLIVYPIRGRYNKPSCILIPVSENRWKFESKGSFVRYNGSQDDPHKISSVDPEGGPMFGVGDVLNSFFPLLPHDRIVSIDIEKGQGIFFNTEPTTN